MLVLGSVEGYMVDDSSCNFKVLIVGGAVKFSFHKRPVIQH